MATLDLVREFDALAAVQPELRQQYFAGPVSAAGNAWVASRLAEVSGQRGR